MYVWRTCQLKSSSALVLQLELINLRDVAKKTRLIYLGKNYVVVICVQCVCVCVCFSYFSSVFRSSAIVVTIVQCREAITLARRTSSATITKQKDFAACSVHIVVVDARD